VALISDVLFLQPSSEAVIRALAAVFA